MQPGGLAATRTKISWICAPKANKPSVVSLADEPSSILTASGISVARCPRQSSRRQKQLLGGAGGKGISQSYALVEGL